MVDGYEKRVMDKRLILVLRIVLLHLSQELIWLTGILSRDWELPRWQWSHSPTWRAVSSCSRSGLQLIWLLPPSFKSWATRWGKLLLHRDGFFEPTTAKRGFLAGKTFLPDSTRQLASKSYSPTRNLTSFANAHLWFCHQMHTRAQQSFFWILLTLSELIPKRPISRIRTRTGSLYKRVLHLSKSQTRLL